MKKITLLFVVALLLMTVPCFAQGARNASYLTQTKSTFTNLEVTGMNNTGNPGYLVMRSTAIRNNSQIPANTYYLWVGARGQLCIASHLTISDMSSFPTGNWDTDESCTAVGGQS